MSLARKTILVLAVLAATYPAQHIQFGPLFNQGDLGTKPAIDSKGNLIALVTTLAPGSFGTPGRLVDLLVRYGEATGRACAPT